MKNYKCVADSEKLTEYAIKIKEMEIMEKTFEVWNDGEWKTIRMNQKVFVGKCGSGQTVFGEHATLARATKTMLIFKTESGVEVKTGIEDLNTKGKLKSQFWFVSLIIREEEEYIKRNVSAY